MSRDLLSRLSSPGESLKEQILHSGIWASLLNGGQRVLQILKLIILSRLLLPEDFGLLGIALITMMALQQFSRLGFKEALIQHPEDDVDPYLDTVWVVGIGRGVLLAVLMFGAAGPVAGVFNEPRAIPILQALSLAVLLRGLANPAVTYYKKNLNFHKEFTYQMSGTAIDFVVAVCTAIVFGTVWALVYGILARELIKLVLSHLLTGHTVQPRLSKGHAMELLDFGQWIFASSVVVFLVTTGDDAFVGWYLGTVSLGIYQVGFRLSNAPATEVAHVIGNVMFPSVSKLQDDTEQVRRLFSHALILVCVLAVPMSIGMILIAPEFVIVVLGENWLPMVPVMQVLSGAGLLRALAALTGPVYQGLGIPEWEVYENLFRLVTIVFSIWPLSEAFGATGAAASVLLAIGSSLIFGMYKMVDLIDVSLATFIRALLMPVFSSMGMAVVVFYMKGPTVGRVVLPIVAGVVVYVAFTFMFLRVSGVNMESVVDSISGESENP